MNKIFRCLFIFIVLFYSRPSSGQVYMDMAMDTTMTFEEIVEEGEKFFDTFGKGQHTGYKGFQRWKYWMKRCLDEKGFMLSNSKAEKGFSNFQSVFTTPPGAGMNPTWTDMGPFNTTNTTGWSSHLGRISAIGVDDSNNNHLIVGSPTGGVWQSYNCGGSWVPIYDDQTNMNIYSLAISPHNPDHYFAGTWGAGLMRSIDAGATWYDVPSIPNLTRIVAIEVNPLDSNNVLIINEGGNVFYSIDGGDTFSNTLIHTGTLYDVEYQPNSATTVFASGVNGVYKSEDAGWSFTEIMGPWKSSGITYNPIMMAVTNDDPDYLYVLEADNGGFGNLYLSEDGGTTFAVQSTNDNEDNNIMGYVLNVKGGQAPRDMDIAVNPSDKTEVHVGGIMSYRSFDSGANWTQTSHWLTYDPLPFIHADVDIVEYIDGRLYFGTDGGLFISDDQATSFIDKTAGLSIRQFYRMTSSEDGSFIVAGSQDNGTSLYSDTTSWVDFIGADGMIPVIDRYNNNVIYASIQYGHIYKTLDGGNSLAGNVFASPGRGDWVTPFAQDPLVPHTFYQGKQQMHKTTDSTQTWVAISDFVMNNPADTLMQEMAIANDDNNYIIAAFSEQVFKTTDGGSNWTDITPSFGFSNVNYVHLHPNDKNWIAMTLSGTSSRLVESTDGGATWSDIMGNLPNLAAECVLYEGGPKNGMYVAMDPGVYYKNDDYTNWMLVSQSMPNVLVAELYIHGCDLYAATFGRGLWQTALLDNSMLYADGDGDGYGDENVAIHYCESNPLGYISQGGDCNDSDSNINPGAPEICNNIDDNCNNFIDASDLLFTGILLDWYLDADGDGEGSLAITMQSCTQPVGYVKNALDCNDADATIYSAAVEECDGIDNNCNNIIDEVTTSTSTATTWYLDADGDGYGDSTTSQLSCSQPSGYVDVSTDCNDTDPNIYPGAEEHCDGLDNDCNGQVDDDCDIEDCDGNYLFINQSFQDIYSADVALYSDAVIENGNQTQVFTAGSSIELLPGFEIKQGKKFEAEIKPCINGVSTIQASLTNELEIINHDVRKRQDIGELVRIEIISSSTHNKYLVIFTKDDINLKHILSQLPTDRYVIFIESNSLQWNREFDVVAAQTD